MSRFLSSRVRRLETNRPPDPRTFVMPPENRAAVDHLIAKVRANPGRWPDLEETIARAREHARERTARA